MSDSERRAREAMEAAQRDAEERERELGLDGQAKRPSAMDEDTQRQHDRARLERLEADSDERRNDQYREAADKLDPNDPHDAALQKMGNDRRQKIETHDLTDDELTKAEQQVQAKRRRGVGRRIS